MQSLLKVLAFLFGMFMGLVFYASVLAVFALSAIFLGDYWGSMPLGIMAAIVITKFYVISVFLLFRATPPDMEIKGSWYRNH